MRTNKLIYFGQSIASLRFSAEQTFAHTLDVTYSQTTDYRYRDASGNKLFNVLDESTKTITWTIASNSPIESGTFLDGSPWVKDNGDIHLVAVSPEPETIFVNASAGDPAGYITNGTILNPDFGKVPSNYVGHGDLAVFTDSQLDGNVDYKDGVVFPDGSRVAWPAQSDYVQTTAGAPVVNSSLEPTYMLPLDGRSGLNTSKDDPDGGGGTNGGTVGEFYSSSTGQVWDRITEPLQAHDLVLSAISHSDRKDNNYWNGYHRESLYDLLGCLVVVPNDGTDYSTRFRPPVNWDPADRANAPYFTENASLESHNFTYPGVGMYDNTPVTWGIQIADYFDPTKWASTNEDASPLRLGSVRLMVGGTEFDDTVQGCIRSMDVTWNEYASDEAVTIEVMTMLAFDSNYTFEGRTKVRRALTQRGIDVYGGFRSLGKWNSPNGGHSEPYDWYLLWAYLGTGAGSDRDDIQDCFDGNLGSVSNGTNKTVADYDGGLHNIGSVLGHLRKFTASDFVHPGRIDGLTVVGTGTDAGIHYVDVAAPLCNIAGTADPVDGPLSTPHDRLYHVAGIDERVNDTGTPVSNELDTGRAPQGYGSQGRWGTRNNQSEINRGHFIGMYVRNPDTGAISRVIDSEGRNSTGTADTTAYEGNWYTNTTQRLYLQESIGTITSNLIDLSPMVLEDFGVRDIFRSINYAANLQSFAGPVNYTWATVRGQLILPFIRNALVAEGRALPTYWDIPYSYVTKLWSDPVMTGIVQDEGLVTGRPFTITNNSFPSSGPNDEDKFNNLWKALIRQEVLGGALPAADTTGRADKIANWPSSSSATWIEINHNAVSNVTAVLEPPSAFLYGANTAVVEDLSGSVISSGSSENVLNRFRRVIVDVGGGDIRDGLFVQSKATRGLPVSFVTGKSLYVWQSGATNPIELIKHAETPVPSADPSDEQKWDQTWVLPASTPTWPSTAVSWSSNETYTFFYADPQP